MRLVELLKIVHALTYKFNSIELDYIDRNYNKLADSLAKQAATMNTFGDVGEKYRIVFKIEKLMDHVNVKF